MAQGHEPQHTQPFLKRSDAVSSFRKDFFHHHLLDKFRFSAHVDGLHHRPSRGVHCCHLCRVLENSMNDIFTCSLIKLNEIVPSNYLMHQRWCLGIRLYKHNLGIPVKWRVARIYARLRYRLTFDVSLVPRSHPQKEGKGSGDFGPFSWFGQLWARAHGALEQSSNLIGQYGCVGDSNLYSGQWPCYIHSCSQ